jgi:2-polyprenyl-6-methoxyphenol hydroxylase-like FAD-dependent oxidoreductase
LRVLIVGGGVAGLTLAALLRQRGEDPTVVEALEEYGTAGYTVTLWPMGNRVLRGLGLTEGFRERSAALERTVMRDGRGKLLRSVEVGARMVRHGEARTLERTDLVDLLRSHGGGVPVRMGTTVRNIEQAGDAARVAFSDGSEEEFDLVVGADGFRSRVRSLVFGEVAPRPTGSALFWWWQEAPDLPDGEITQYAGVGRFFGVYPVKDRVSCVAVLPEDEMSVDGRGASGEERRDLLRGHFHGFGGEPLRPILELLSGAGRVD